MTTEKTENNEELPLVSFEKTLSPEEAVLIRDYVENPAYEVLSKTFDDVLNQDKE